MIKIGTMIGDRYEVLERIGMGGMSDVYKAKDHKLNRHVAVKVLKQEFSENTNFVSKFRVEAQAAASLMHPNIVNVYDVGEDNGVYYIVMELVDGITLKKYIEKKARLSVREALSIAIQACMGQAKKQLMGLWQQLSGGQSYLTLLFKVVGITWISELVSGICKDSGYSAVASQVELFGKIAILFAGMPIFLALAETIAGFAGG